MQRRTFLGTVAAGALPARAQQAEPGRWAFAPARDEFTSDALLDLRWLNENEAGQSGFVRVDEYGDFLTGDGAPIRFWCVNTTVEREKPFVARPRWNQTEPKLSRHARFLAKRGVNMVRLHAFLNPPVTAPSLEDINKGERDWIWRTVAAMKKEGIYTTISPYWANNMKYNAAWGLEGGATQNPHALLFFSPQVQAAYRAWLRALYAEENPYTGIPLAKDPAVALIQLQNEDSLLFYTVDRLAGPQRRHFGERYAQWCARKYGSVAGTLDSWGDRMRTDEPEAGFLDFHILWEMTQNRTGARARRLADQLEFWVTVMREFNAETAKYLREELGCGQLINAGNWKTGDSVRLEDLERYAYTAGDVMAVNRYYSSVHLGVNRTWAIINGDQFTNSSVLLNPREFALNLKQPAGYPFLVTESAWVMPNGYATEGPFLISAYSSLNGIDGFFWFNTGDEEWTPPQSANGYLASQQKWMFAHPDMLGMFPAAALMYRRFYLKPGDPVVLEERSLQDMYQRRTPIIAEAASYDPVRDAGDIAPTSNVQAGTDPLAFFAGPVRVVFGGEPENTGVADLSQYIKENRTVVESVTGEVTLNSAEGWCTVNAPKAQGVAAHFARRGAFELRDVKLRSANEYGQVLVVSMDDAPIAESRQLLVQVGTQSRPTAWQEEAKEIKTAEGAVFAGFEVVNFGRAPWQVVRAKVELEIGNPGLSRARVLDPNGYGRAEFALERTEGGVRLQFPEDALYVVLT
ncbi:MAG: hypothetical protein MUC42_11980 [Bryobacter sp.]|nr:hypothetical protein [Bryobacter sp.]